MRTQLTAALLVLASPLAAQQAPLATAQDACARVTLSEEARPSYSISGSWISPQELVLVDALDNRLVRLDSRGRLLGTQSPSLETQVKSAFKENFLPIAIHPDEGGAWLELVGGRFAHLDSTAEVNATRDLWGSPVGDGGKLIATLGWTVAGGDVFGYGNYDMADGTSATGFFRLNLGRSTGPGILRPLPESNTTQLWYRLGLPFVAAIDETGYALSMENQKLSIVKSEPGKERLRTIGSFTGPLSKPPRLADFNTPDDFRVIMGTLSSSTTPMGLYGWNGKLYLLWRYESEGGNHWFLSRIDPEARKLEATAVIPSDAAHLMAIPGPTQWAFIEKGPVRGYMTQEVGSVLFVRSSNLKWSPEQGNALCSRR